MLDVEVLIRLLVTCAVVLLTLSCLEAKSRQIRDVIEKSIQVVILTILTLIITLIWVV